MRSPLPAIPAIPHSQRTGNLATTAPCCVTSTETSSDTIVARRADTPLLRSKSEACAPVPTKSIQTTQKRNFPVSCAASIPSSKKSHPVVRANSNTQLLPPASLPHSVLRTIARSKSWHHAQSSPTGSFFTNFTTNSRPVVCNDTMASPLLQAPRMDSHVDPPAAESKQTRRWLSRVRSYFSNKHAKIHPVQTTPVGRVDGKA